MAENFPKLMEEIESQIQEVLCTTTRINTKTTQKHTVVRLLKELHRENLKCS